MTDLNFEQPPVKPDPNTYVVVTWLDGSRQDYFGYGVKWGEYDLDVFLNEDRSRYVAVSRRAFRSVEVKPIKKNGDMR